MNDETWESVAARSNNITNSLIATRYREKFDASYYLQRTDILQYVQTFIESDKKLLVLTGRAGTGKSNFICSLHNALPAKNLTLLQDCGHLYLDDKTSIDEHIQQIFEFSASTVNMFKLLYKSDSSYTMILLFDAINEFPEPKQLLYKLSEFVRSIDTPAIKVLATARIPAWDSLKRFLIVPFNLEFHTSGPNSYVNIEAFSYEELPLVYERYQQVYDLKTSFDELSPQNKTLLLSPVMLKLVAAAYQGSKLPNLISDHVYMEYLTETIGQASAVLKRIVEIMYVFGRRELELKLLNEFLKTDDLELCRGLVDSGVLSTKIVNESLLKSTEIIFVTYEFTFNFLLSAYAIRPTPVTTKSLLEHLEIAQKQSFVQLREALVLLMRDAIIQNQSPSMVLELARLERSDVGPFIVNVVNAIYVSGWHEIAKGIVHLLAIDKYQNCNLLAIQIGYNLKLDNLLTDMVLSDDVILRDTASIYLYQRWNQERLQGNFHDGYKAFYTIVNNIRTTNPRRAQRSLLALFTLSSNLLSHLVDDPDSLLPLVEVYKNLVRKMLGTEAQLDRNTSDRFTNELAFRLISTPFAFIMRKFIKDTDLNLVNTIDSFFADPRNKRALLDSSIFWNIDNLLDHKEKLKYLLTWKHNIPAVQIRGPILYHVYNSPGEHLDFLEDLFYDFLEQNLVQETIHIISAIIYGFVCRVTRYNEIDPDHLYRVERMTIDLWILLAEVGSKIEIRNTLMGLFTIESLLQRRVDTTTASPFLKRLVEEVDFKPKDVKFLLNELERCAYLGYPEFAVTTILDRRIRDKWENRAQEAAIKTLANLRTFFQDVVDSLLLESAYNNRDFLWDKVKEYNSTPDIQDIVLTSWNHWFVAASVTPVITKLGGVILFDLAISKSVDEFMDRALTTLLAALSDYATIDIRFMHWFRAHIEDWDDFEKWQIPREYDNPASHPEIQKYASERVQEFIDQFGKGMHFEEHI